MVPQGRRGGGPLAVARNSACSSMRGLVRKDVRCVGRMRVRKGTCVRSFHEVMYVWLMALSWFIE